MPQRKIYDDTDVRRAVSEKPVESVSMIGANSLQTIDEGAPTEVNYDVSLMGERTPTSTPDPVDNSITVHRPGHYSVSISVRWLNDSLTTGDKLRVAGRVNNVAENRLRSLDAHPGSDRYTTKVSAPVDLEPGDTITVFVLFNTGTATDTERIGETGNTHLAVTRL